MNQVEIDKIAANHDVAKSAVQALQHEALAIRDLQDVIKAFQPGSTVTVQSHADLVAAVRNLSETNTALQAAVPAVPAPPFPPATSHIVQPSTRLDQTHNQSGVVKHP